MPRAGKLVAYLTSARPRPASDQAEAQPRPEGALLWWQAATRSHVDVALQLARRLARSRPGIHVLLTAAPDNLPQNTQSTDVIARALPADDGGAAQAFIRHWRPDVGVWTAGDLKPALLAAAHRQGMPLFLVDADEARLSHAGWRFLSDSTRTSLRRFSTIMARTPATEAFLRRKLGLRDGQISVTGALREESRPLPCNASDREELSALLRGRPVWLAAWLQPDEIATVLAANQAITRMSHRVVLVVAPATPEDSAPFHHALRASGLSYIAWSEGALPDEMTQVILADTRGELGLWYRIAPISFMGSSLMSGMHGSNPNEPAAHGSAILYGPNIGDHLGTYSHYAEAGAARIVRDGPTLADAVQRMFPPDKSAAMAHAAWDVATQGAAVMDSLAEAILDALDARKAG